MIRRSCNSRFRQPILDDVKITTIRDKAWPIGVPIMIFEWEGKPYRSKQVEIAPVVVELAFTIVIRRDSDGAITYEPSGFMPDGKRWLWQTEGFNSQADMDEWFRPLIKPQGCVFKSLMRFFRKLS